MTLPLNRMLCAAALALAGAAALAAQQAQAPPPQRQPVFRGGANFVLVDAYPQRDGKIIEGLAAADFDIFEDGKPQKVDSLEFVRMEPFVVNSERRDPNNQREMLQLAADPHNRVFVVFLDVLHTTIDGSHAIRGPMVNALNRIVAPNDLFGVVTHLMRPRDLVLGRRLESVEEQLTKYWPWGERQRLREDPNDPAEQKLRACFEFKPIIGLPRWYVEEGAVKRELYKVLIERRREDRVLTSLIDHVRYLGSLREARTTMLVVTDGWLLFKPDGALVNEGTHFKTAIPGMYIGPGGRIATATSVSDPMPDAASCLAELNNLANLDDERRLRELYTEANRANVSFYPIAASGLTVFDSSIAERVVVNPNTQPGETTLGREFDRTNARVQGLRTLAENTDGIAVVQTNDLAAGLKRVADDLSAYYLLGYYSTNAKFDGRLRRIEVKVKQPNVRVRARRGYVAPTEAMLAPPTSAASAAAAAAAAATAAPVDDALGVLARLRAGADVYTHGVARDGQLEIAVELSSRAIELGTWMQGGEVTVEASGTGMSSATAKAQIEAGVRGVLVKVPVTGAGPWQVAVRVRGAADPLDDRIEVRPAAGSLLGAPLIYRATPSPRSLLRPAADFQFRRTERAHLEWPISQALDNRTARLLDRKGAPLPVPVTLTERDVDGHPVLAADVLLTPLTDGDYVVEVSATSGTVSERALVPVRVVR